MINIYRFSTFILVYGIDNEELFKKKILYNLYQIWMVLPNNS
jgi:hypothetical protein